MSEQKNLFTFNKENINLDSLVHALNPLPAREREKILVPLMLSGNVPSFIFHFKKVRFHYTDSTGKKNTLILFVSPDYLSIGSSRHFMRMPLTPQSAQQIADSLHCILPTRKIVDEIFIHAAFKPEPRPLTEKRDSLITFLQHDSIIQKQLGFKHPLRIIAGIKKDIVQTPRIYSGPKANRVAIYGWHKPDGSPIQPLYTGHVDWYVDYSHGARLIYEKLILNGRIADIKDLLNSPLLQKALCDEDACGYTRYK